MQLDMFETDTAMFLMKELSKTREVTENVRRGLFARYNELERMFLDFQARVEDKLSEKGP